MKIIKGRVKNGAVRFMSHIGGHPEGSSWRWGRCDVPTDHKT